LRCAAADGGGRQRGGNLAVATCLRAKEDGWKGIAQQLLFYPVCDAHMDAPSHALYGQMPFLTTEAMAAMWRHYHPAMPAHPLASIMQYPDLAGLPAAVLVTAELDILRDEGEAFGLRLQQAGVPFPAFVRKACCMGLPTSAPWCRRWQSCCRGLCKAVFRQDIGCWTSLIHATVHVYSCV
jgi:acetyl esterase/lipase